MEKNIKNSYTYEDLLSSSRGELFGPNRPRLPKPEMLMIDRITKIDDKGGQFGKGVVIAELDINPDLWFFKCHFSDDPVMPGCLGLDGLWQMLGFYLSWRGCIGRGRAFGCRQVVFNGQILPNNKKVLYDLQIKKVSKMETVAMGIGEGSVYVDDRQVYKAEGLKVAILNKRK